MKSDPDDERSPFAVGYAWAVRIMSIGFEMAIPTLLGVWLDRLLGTVVLFVILGALLGMAVGFMQLLKIAQESKK